MYSILLDVHNLDASSRALPPSSWPEAKEYLRRMQSWSTRASWGGVAELFLLSHMSDRPIYLVERHRDGQSQLFLAPLGPQEARKPSICLAWSGVHYDAVFLPECAWKALFPGHVLGIIPTHAHLPCMSQECMYKQMGFSRCM